LKPTATTPNWFGCERNREAIVEGAVIMGRVEYKEKDVECVEVISEIR